MSKTPPLLPEEALARVLRLARFDGLGVLVVSGLFAVLSALVGDRTGAFIGLLIAGAGAIELHGGGLLVHGDIRGMRWLVGSQLLLMVTLLGYCAFRLYNVDLELLRSAVTDDMKKQLKELGWTIDDFVLLAYNLTWKCLAAVTIVYQGGMALYYLRRRGPVAKALEPVE